MSRLFTYPSGITEDCCYTGAVRLEEIDYYLPPEQIAQRPAATREGSRLLVLDRKSGDFSDHRFTDFPDLLSGRELIVLNNARVIPARLLGRRAGIHSQAPSRASRREHLTGEVEAFLARQLEPDVWEALVHPGRKIKTGERLFFGDGELEGEVIARGEFGLRTLRLVSHDSRKVSEHIDRLGHVPLPPYIDREDEAADRERYQTVFAKNPGAVAAPTAGLHFTDKVLGTIRDRGVEVCELTLDVGLGTFQPVHTETLEGHRMHAESYQVSEDTAQRVRKAYSAGRPILAVGTTVVRALEDAALRVQEADKHLLLCAGRAETRLLIIPGFKFQIVNALLTNFHLPRSTLLALVSAFAGREHTLAAYKHAVQAGYRFYSYGDCMLIR